MLQNNLLEVRNLNIRFKVEDKFIHAVNDASFEIKEQETLGIIGESGCGKSVTMYSLLNLLPTPPGIVDGEAIFENKNLFAMSEKAIRKIRGKKISMVFQEPMTSLNPVYKIGEQIIETIMLHDGVNRRIAISKTLELLSMVEIPNPEKRIWDYPHQLSGGMRQRMMIAMALSCKPKILLADEPTTALDVTIQAQILNLLDKFKEEYGMSVVIVTHDAGVVAEISQRVLVFYAGQVVEEAETTSLFQKPSHPYTEGLLKCIPLLNSGKKRLQVIEGTVPDPYTIPKGCLFSPRCKYAMVRCSQEKPLMRTVGKNHRVACHIAKERYDSKGVSM